MTGLPLPPRGAQEPKESEETVESNPPDRTSPDRSSSYRRVGLDARPTFPLEGMA